MNKILNHRFKLVGLSAAIVILFGLAFLAGTISSSQSAAFAQSTTPVQATPTQSTPSTNSSQAPAAPATEPAGTAETTDPAGTADTAEPSGTAETAEPAGAKETETDNTAALQAQAKITIDQARTTALAKVPGTVVKASLDDENGKPVYGVEITPTAGGVNQDVKVDAVTGTILTVEAGD
jgi:uncharacterized membrane protein YkoI